jgi:hypothetical protein
VDSGEGGPWDEAIPAVAGADALVANVEVLRRYGVLYGKSALHEARNGNRIGRKEARKAQK